MLKITFVIILIIFVFAGMSSEALEIKLISPIGAVARSIIPGWGQFYTHDKLQGVIVFLSVSIIGSLGIQEDAEYRHYYNDFYRQAVYSGSDKANYYFDKANDYYKLSRFLLYTAAGIWAYSAIDAYIDAHMYNAKQQVIILGINDERLKPLKSLY